MTVMELSPQKMNLAPTQSDPGLLGGRFRLGCWAGELGGVSLWQATDELLRRPVTVHILPGQADVPPGLAEAVQAAARVNDVRLTAIFDACYEPGCSYLISEWAGEASLEQLLLAERPGPALAAMIVAEAAQALAAAHAGHRPHLCLTPRSLHWGRSGLKITGLGVDAALTGANRGGADAAAADTAALARILYAMLTGYWPGDPAMSMLPAAPRARTGPVASSLYEPAQLRPGVPALLSAITCHALQDQPGRSALSIRTPAELAAALLPARHQARVLAQPHVAAPDCESASVQPSLAAAVQPRLAAAACAPSRGVSPVAPREGRFLRRVNFASCAG